MLFSYGLPEDESEVSADDADVNLIPELVEKLAVPILHHQLEHCWDMLSTSETKYAVSATNLVFRYVSLSSSSLRKLVSLLRDRLIDAVANLMVFSNYLYISLLSLIFFCLFELIIMLRLWTDPNVGHTCNEGGTKCCTSCCIQVWCLSSFDEEHMLVE